MAKQKSSSAAKPAKKPVQQKGQQPPTPAMPVRQHYKLAGGCC